ncbi:MAG TPA: NYN domain-containing protein [Vicinamibacterales bacterium]
MTEQRLKIAVFVDFDNIEIGVKTTLNVAFDVGTVLEAIKERGEVVTKIAYGDWTRAGDYSRLLTQHAIKMVQRNLTPGGDKNGADINLALDALEMALTHDHINAYVIVGGDSDFLSLVEKLKQYDKTVIVVGGRAFTSVILQRNCHEFIAYENLINVGQSARRHPERGRSSGTQPVSAAFPLIQRALKVLSEREVTPQLGLLKSTLLQLDSTFSEKNYGAGSFRDFAEKLAQAGLIRLNQSGRNLLVEIKDGEPGAADHSAEAAAPVADRHHHERHYQGRGHEHHGPVAIPAPEPETVPEDRQPAEVAPSAQPAPHVPGPGEALAVQQAEALAMLRRVIEQAPGQLRWPMYVRNVKQLLRAADSAFDERRYGFGGILDLLRASQRDALLRLERDRQGVLRVFPGNALQRPSSASPVQEATIEEPMAAAEAPADGAGAAPGPSVDVSEVTTVAVEAETRPVIDAETIDTVEVSGEQPTAEGPAGLKPKRRRGTAVARKTTGPRKPRAAASKAKGKKKE